MTREQRVDRFFLHHARMFRYCKQSEMWEDFMELVRSFDPARDLPMVAAHSATANAENLLGMVQGFNACINAIETLQPPQTQTEPEETFSEEQP